MRGLGDRTRACASNWICERVSPIRVRDTGMAAGPRTFIRFAKDAEDVASGLRAFRDSLPRNATKITAIIGKLFAISSILREIDVEQGDNAYTPSSIRVQNELDYVLFMSLRRTLEDAFDMFARSRERPIQTVWDDLMYKMEYEEQRGFLERLELYHEFLRAQADVLRGYSPRNVDDLRLALVTLANSQEASALPSQRRSIDASGMLLTLVRSQTFY